MFLSENSWQGDALVNLCIIQGKVSSVMLLMLDIGYYNPPSCARVGALTSRRTWLVSWQLMVTAIPLKRVLPP